MADSDESVPMARGGEPRAPAIDAGAAVGGSGAPEGGRDPSAAAAVSAEPSSARAAEDSTRTAPPTGTEPGSSGGGGAPAPGIRERARALLRRVLQGRGWEALCIVLDATLLYLGVVVAWLAAPADAEPIRGLVWFFPPLVMALLAVRGGYRPWLHIRLLDRVAQLIAFTAVATMILLALENGGVAESDDVLVRAWVFGTVYVISGRILVGVIRRGAQADGLVGKAALIVGAGRVGAQVERRLDTHPELGLRPVGYLDDDPVPAELLPTRRAPVLGPPSELPRVAEETGAQHVILAFLSAPDHVLVPLIRECQERGLELSFVPRLFDSVNTRVELEHMGGLPLYELRTVNPRGFEFAIKHGAGKLLTVLLLILLGPLMIATTLAVRLTSPGPILYRQRRIGRDGREFELLKFRSMRVPEESAEQEAAAGKPSAPLPSVGEDLGPGGLEANHLRMTPIGRFIRRTSIDELPQLFNVLRGDMTLVGPRPERPEFVELFGQSIRRYDDRHRVKSGITGWAQVHGLRGRTSLADRVEWDNYYIENWSLWLDVKILVMTLTAPFRHSE